MEEKKKKKEKKNQVIFSPQVLWPIVFHRFNKFERNNLLLCCKMNQVYIEIKEILNQQFRVFRGFCAGRLIFLLSFLYESPRRCMEIKAKCFNLCLGVVFFSMSLLAPIQLQ